jgi:IclR family KDG regulon transcriptional repressor
VENPRLSAPEIVSRAAMHKTTAYRMLAELVDQGFLARNEMTGKYSIGPVMYLLGSLYQQADSLQVAAGPVVALLSELTGEACSLAILSEDVVVHVLLGESRHEVGWDRYIGMTLPAHTCALGKSLLSALTDAEIDSLYPEEALRSRTPNTALTRSQLKMELAEIRASGVAIDDEGCVPGIAGRGSPVLDHRGRIVAALSISVPVFRFPTSVRPLYASATRMGAQLISYRLGYRSRDTSITTVEQLQSWWLKAKAEQGSV